MSVPRPARRRVLAAVTGGLAGLAVGAPVLAACTAWEQAPPPRPDPLGPVAHRAGRDVRLANSVALAHPALAGAAGAVAADRQAHADALWTELRRARPAGATASAAPSASSSTTPAPSPVPVPPDQTAARAALGAALRAAQHEAAAMVGPAPGHRAGLLASIAACCASHQAVLP